jgi:hypothetical protein
MKWNQQLRHLLDKLCQALQNGENLLFKEEPTRLGWSWINADSKEEYGFIPLSNIKQMIRFRSPINDRLLILISGQTGLLLKAQKEIIRLENLKAFW